MKNYTLPKVEAASILVLLIGCGLANPLYAQDDKLTLTVNVTQATCTVATPTVGVDMGTVNTHSGQFSGIGTTGGTGKDFSIKLTGCAGVNKVSVTANPASGSSVTGGYFPLSGSGTVATGVALQIMAHPILGENSLQSSDNTTPVIFPVTSSDGSATLNYTANYVQVADKITPGTANATVQLNFTYQ